MTANRFNPPTGISITNTARAVLLPLLAEIPNGALHVEITPDGQFDLSIAPREPSDRIEVLLEDIVVSFDRDSAQRGHDLQIDYVDHPSGAGFKIQSPYKSARVQSLHVQELKQWMDAGRVFELIDVRTEWERETACIHSSRLLDAAEMERLRSLDRETVLVFQCHHGIRSRTAAERFVREGFRQVFNLEGGIEAWSQSVDPAVPRY
jgi:monothiol glutaredoxin